MLDAVEKNQASPCEELLNEIVNYKEWVFFGLFDEVGILILVKTLQQNPHCA